MYNYYRAICKRSYYKEYDPEKEFKEIQKFLLYLASKCEMVDGCLILQIF